MWRNEQQKNVSESQFHREAIESQPLSDHERNTISFAWQNMVKRWANDPSRSIDELRDIMQSDIAHDLNAPPQTHTLPFLIGSDRDRDIAEYRQCISGSMTDIGTSYLITETYIPFSGSFDHPYIKGLHLDLDEYYDNEPDG